MAIGVRSALSGPRFSAYVAALPLAPKGRNVRCLDTHKFADDKGRGHDRHEGARAVIVVEKYWAAPLAAECDLP
jgi:hypothetical protein